MPEFALAILAALDKIEETLSEINDGGLKWPASEHVGYRLLELDHKLSVLRAVAEKEFVND